VLSASAALVAALASFVVCSLEAHSIASGGLLAIAHRDGDQYVLDLVRGTRHKFDPQQVTAEYAQLVKAYGVGVVTGDAYASEWVKTAWRELRVLERQAHRGGRESIDHPRGQHDDYANAVCGVLRQLSDTHGFRTDYAWVDGTPIGGEDTLTAEQRAERRRQEADAFYRARLTAYLAAHGAFGAGPPFGQL
jgi:hypothetical protein